MSHTNSPQTIPGPQYKLWGYPALMQLRKDFLGTLAQRCREYPHIARWRAGTEHVVHVFHPELVRQVLNEEADGWVRWERLTATFAQSMGQSVLVTEGALWQRQRRMMQAGFSPRRVAAYAQHMSDACACALDKLPMTGADAVHDMHALMTQVTMDVIVRALFGHAREIDSAQVSHAIHALSEEGFAQLFRPRNLPDWFPLPSIRKARQGRDFLNGLIAREIDQRRMELATQAPQNQAHDSTDLLTMLLNARDPEHPEQGLSAQEVHDQTMVMFQAGHETSANALTWWAGLIAQHPQIQNRLQAELQECLQGKTPTLESVQQLPWLQASLKESLRLYPPAAILMTRRATRDVACGSWRITKGDLIAITPAVIQRDERWFSEPDRFMPERFLPGAPEIPRGAWIPFGTGPRVCLGQHFAMMEMAIIAAMVLQRFSLKWPESQPWPQREVGITLRPGSKMGLVLRPRALLEAP